MLYSAEIEPFTRRRPERRAPAGNKYRAVVVSGGVEKERDYFGRRDDRYDDRRGYDRGYDRRGYDDRDRAFCGVPCAFARRHSLRRRRALPPARPLRRPPPGRLRPPRPRARRLRPPRPRAATTTTAATAAGTTTTAATAGATTTTAATTAARHAQAYGHTPLSPSRFLPPRLKHRGSRYAGVPFFAR